MDEFGVLTQKYGLKPQGKSAPMAETKRQQQQQPTKTANSENGSGVDDGNLGFGTSTKLDNDGYGGNFGGSSFDLESVLGGSSKGNFDDDIFGGMPGLDVSRNGGFSTKESGLVGDLLGGFGGVGDSKDEVERRSGEEGVKPGGVVGDLLGGFGGSGDKWEGMDYTGEGEVDRCGEEVKQDGQVDDLLGGFGGSEDKFKGMDNKDEGEVEKSGEDVKRGGPVGDLLGGFGGSGEKWDGTDGKDEKEVMRNADNVKRGGPVGDLLGGFGGSGDKWDGMGGADGAEMKESKVDVKISGATGDLLGGFGGLVEKMEGTDYKDEGDMERSGDRMDDLIPAFGGSSNYVDGENIDEQPQQSTFHSHKPATTSADPFIVFETGSTPGNTAFTDHLDQLGELTSSGVTRPGGLSSSSNSDEAKDAKATYPNLMFDADLYSEGHPKTAQETPSGGSAMAEKPSSNFNFDGIFTDFTAATIREEFEEFEGESEERRSARLARFERIKKREATAVAEMNQRDHQRQQEQDERCRISEIMDSKIKHWATGKEGNMRALLSSLQDVLWSECGWQPVSLTDLITSAAVKKVYFKATLFVHPDKVQQKGANLQQKYIAEKVFDILKEAYNKFNKEELY